jgi:N-acetylglucosaminyldiphosphoundecaprenol N-acetyl-beta-D-mannosaminyltransferase
MQRVPGAELMPGLCELAANNGYSIFLYGAAPEVNRRAADVIGRRYPGIRIAGRQHGYLKDAEMEAFLRRLRELSPDILFVALGSPKQEQWIMEHMPQTGIKVCQGVGGTLDVISGRVRRAPRVFRSIHLEWLYRLLADPRRLLRQTALPRFVWKVLVSRFGRHQHSGRSTG